MRKELFSQLLETHLEIKEFVHKERLQKTKGFDENQSLK